MNLKQFAKQAGVSIVECDPAYGGTVAYKCSDAPNTTYCGYQTEDAAYKGWMKGAFGEQTAKAILSLLKQTEKKSSGETK